MSNATTFFTGNLILNLSIFSWALAQVLKFLVLLIIHRKLDWSYIWTSGGMPSSHSSFVCTCATAMGCMYGWSSPLFTIATVLAVVVMYDAANVRKATGEQAKILNYIMAHWKDMKPEFFGEELKELMGHTKFQVVMGGVLGIVVGLVGVNLFA